MTYARRPNRIRRSSLLVAPQLYIRIRYAMFVFAKTLSSGLGRGDRLYTSFKRINYENIRTAERKRESKETNTLYGQYLPSSCVSLSVKVRRTIKDKGSGGPTNSFRSIDVVGSRTHVTHAYSNVSAYRYVLSVHTSQTHTRTH